MLLIYHSLVEQRLNYCSEVWDTQSDGLSEKFQKLQSRAVRIITKSAYDASSSELLVERRWRALAHERRTKKAIMMYKVINNLAPEYLKYLFRETNQVPVHLLQLDSRLVLSSGLDCYRLRHVFFSKGFLGIELDVLPNYHDGKTFFCSSRKYE
jgi:hypothetical protein